MFLSFKKHRLPTLTIHFLVAGFALALVIAAFAYNTFMVLLKAGPVLDRGLLHLEQNIQILDRNDNVLYQFSGDENRVFLPTEGIPDVMRKAIVAIEDERFFYRQPCVDVRSVLRALYANYFNEDGQTQGASTITQQLVRTLYLTREKTYKRKFYEVVLACRLETTLTKEEILTLYLNGVGFGNGTYGIEQASQMYFGNPASDLTVAQAAVLASIPQRPTYYSPYGLHLRTLVPHDLLNAARKGLLQEEQLFDDGITGLLPRIAKTASGDVRLLGRSDSVVNAMERLAFIDTPQADHARDELVTMRFKKPVHPISAPHFALWMRDEVESLLDTVEQADRWRTAGLKVKTTLDPSLQFIAEDTLEHAKTLLQKYKAKNAALVALDRETREIVAYVGNIDFFKSTEEGQVDMARAPRQPGSSFKPLVYAGAFERGYTPETLIEDAPMNIGGDTPKNYDGGYRGWMSARSAIGNSRNIPAIKAFFDAGGEDRILNLAEAVGVVTPLRYKQEQLKKNPGFTYGWPMAIGAVEVPLVEMVQMYATIAEHGMFSPLTYLCSLSDRTESFSIPLFQIPTMQAIGREAADGVDDILRDPESKPEGYWRTILTIPGMDVGAKTGTSNLCFQRDTFGNCVDYGVNNVWTMGYSDKLVVGVWVGNADATPLEDLADGLTVAAPIWKEFLQRANGAYDPKAECSSPNA